VMVAVLVGVMSPIPVWVSRALRGPLPRRALPAGDVRAAGGEAGAVLLTEINTAVDLVGAAWDAMADYKASAHVAWLMDRGANDNWAKSVVRRSQYDESEAAHAVERVITAIADLPPEDRIPIGREIRRRLRGLGWHASSSGGGLVRRRR